MEPPEKSASLRVLDKESWMNDSSRCLIGLKQVIMIAA